MKGYEMKTRVFHTTRLIAVCALFFTALIGQSTAYAWHMPSVSIWQPSDGDEVSGAVSVGSTYSIERGNVHTVQLLIDGVVVDSVAVHEQSGSHVFVWDSNSVADGPHTIAVRAHEASPSAGHFSEDSIVLNVSNAACNSSADCDDGDDYTEDVCSNPGLPTAACVYSAIACLNNGDCDDSDALTLDSCQAPGTSEAACINPAIACNGNGDCDDADAYTEDVCQNGGTLTAACAHNVIACLNDEDCNDSDALTLDNCQNPGTTVSSCVNTAFSCNTDADCDDSNEYTLDACQNGGTVGALCVNSPIACLSDTDCDDGGALTLDSCSNAGTTAAACVNSPIACNANTDCDDGDANSLDVCINAGTLGAACQNNPVACLNNSDCDDGDALTRDTCVNPGTVTAACVHDPLACNSAADCDDDDSLTLDSCVNPGTPASACTHTAIACNSDADCDDDNNFTQDACVNGGTANATCSNMAIACLNSSDCDDSNSLTIDACMNPGTASASCSHTSVACNVQSDCDDGNAYTLDSCKNGGTAAAICEHAAIACLTNEDCNDNDPKTTDTCTHPGTTQSVCKHERCGNDDDDDHHGKLTLDVLSPEDKLITNQPTLVIEGTTNASSVKVNGNTVPVVDGQFTTVVTLNEGRNTITIKAEKSRNDSKTKTLTVTLDTIPPELVSVNPADGTQFPADTATISFEARMTDSRTGTGIPIDGVSFNVNGDDVPFKFTPGTGILKANIPVSDDDDLLIVTLNAQDLAGNPMSPAVISYQVQSSGGETPGDDDYRGWMVYYSSVTGSYQIYLDKQGVKTAITNSGAYNGRPSFADGVIAYTEQKNDRSEIVVVEVKEVNGAVRPVERLRIAKGQKYNSQASISADGSLVAYVTLGGNKPPSLAVTSTGLNKHGHGKDGKHGDDGRHKEMHDRIITDGLAVFNPSISPDGSQVVFMSNSQGAFSLYTVDVDERNQVSKITAPAHGIDTDPVFSPDGQHIYFSSNRDGQFDIYRIDVAGNNLERITNTPDREVRLAFTTDGDLLCSIKNNGKYGISMVDTSTGQTTALIANAGNSLSR